MSFMRGANSRQKTANIGQIVPHEEIFSYPLCPFFKRGMN